MLLINILYGPLTCSMYLSFILQMDIKTGVNKPRSQVQSCHLDAPTGAPSAYVHSSESLPIGSILGLLPLTLIQA